jgi:putative transcriptional regulator
MNVYDSIIRGLNEAIEYEKGNLKSVKRHIITITPLTIYKADKIKEIRMSLKLSQSVFANIVGVSKKAVEAWEAGKNTPNGPALRMIELLCNEPEIINRYFNYYVDNDSEDVSREVKLKNVIDLKQYIHEKRKETDIGIKVLHIEKIDEEKERVILWRPRKALKN